LPNCRIGIAKRTRKRAECRADFKKVAPFFCSHFHLVFTREQGFHPESTKVTPTGITLKGVLDIFLGGVLAERHSVEQGLGVQELDIQNLVCENGSVDAKRVHHAHGVDEAAVDDSARFHREHKDISV